MFTLVEFPLFILTIIFQLKASGAFRVLADGYVTGESGTGVVHSAPAFGEVCSIIMII